MQPQPEMMAAEMSKRQTVTMMMTWAFALGLFLLALSGVLWNWANLSTTTADARSDLQAVWSPILWNFGFFLLLAGIFGLATMAKNIDPLGRLLLWIVAFILVLLLFTTPSLFFSAP